MSFISAINTSASGLTAQRLRTEVIANNIANVNTTRTQEGGPYARKRVIFAERLKQKGVRVVEVAEDTRTPFKLKYDPGHPDVDESGYVKMPNVNVVTEMVDLISSTRSYQANVSVISASKNMIEQALNIGV